MKELSILLLAAASLVLNAGAATNYAALVISYEPGLDAAAGYTHTNAVLGEPSRVNPYADAVESFNPPYGTNQVLSIGAGGSVTIKFRRPIYDTVRKPFGSDFIIFGNAGFIVTNDFDLESFQWVGTPATDGSMFGQNSGATRVSVSADGKHFFELKPEKTPLVDALYPTDGQGAFDLPVNPELTAADFAGATTEDIRALYAGSGGGSSYNIRWARNKHGKPVRLAFIRFVRVQVIEGKAEIDGFSAVRRHRR